MTRPGSTRLLAATAIGGGITTFLVVAVVVIEGLDIEYSAIVGLPVGVVTGVACTLGLWRYHIIIPRAGRWAIAGYATLGPVVIGLLAVRYVNVGRDLLTVSVIASIAVVAALGVAIGLAVLASVDRG